MIALFRRGPLLAAAVFLLLELVLTLLWQRSGSQVDDLGLYRRYGELVAGGAVPYRDFDLEYPPLAVPPMAIPALVTSIEAEFEAVFAVLIGACGAAGVWVAGETLHHLGASPAARRVAFVALGLSPLAVSAVVGTRYDLLPAALTAAALLAAVRDRLRLASLLLGLGIAAKLYPALLLPLLCVLAWRRGGRRDAIRVAMPAIAVTALAYLPFVLIAPDGVGWSLSRQLARSLQLESLGAGLLLVAHQLAGLDLAWASGKGSQNLVGTLPDVVASLSGVAQILAVVALWIGFARGPADPRRLLRYSAALVAAFVVLGRVLSPQYLVWLILLIPLVAGARGRIALVALGVAGALTTLYFPWRYWDLVKEFDPASSWAVFARNLALLVLLAALVLRPRRSARSRSSAQSPGPR
ncbi:MAG: glycosyltransferase 87 family protein [Gaiella sp.]